MERSKLLQWLPDLPNRHRVELCGFGPIAAAAQASQHLARNVCHQVILVGIAGSYQRERLAVGEAYCFDRVLCHGVGVGYGKSFQSSTELGWNQIEAESIEQFTCTASETIETNRDTIHDSPEKPISTSIQDQIDLDRPRNPIAGSTATPMTLLTACSASANFDEAQERASRYPDASAEDMEGFGVAMACQISNVPLRIIRGISNQAGDRNHGNWKISEAIQSAAKLLAKLIEC